MMLGSLQCMRAATASLRGAAGVPLAIRSLGAIHKSFFEHAAIGDALQHHLLSDSVQWTSIDELRKLNVKDIMSMSPQHLAKERLFNPFLLSSSLNSAPTAAELSRDKTCSQSMVRWHSAFCASALDFDRIRAVFLSQDFVNKQVVVVETSKTIVVCYDEQTRVFSDKTMKDFVLKLSHDKINLASYEDEYVNSIEQDKPAVIDKLRKALSEMDTDSVTEDRPLLLYNMRTNKVSKALPTFYALDNGHEFAITFTANAIDGSHFFGTFDKIRSFRKWLPHYRDHGKYALLKTFKDLGFAEEVLLGYLFKTLSRCRVYLILQSGVISVKSLVHVLKTISAESDNRLAFFVVDPANEGTNGKHLKGTFTVPGQVNYIIRVNEGIVMTRVARDSDVNFVENSFYLNSSRLVGSSLDWSDFISSQAVSECS